MNDESMALVDLDNTICAYDLALQAGLDELRSPEEELYSVAKNTVHPFCIWARMEIIKSKAEFWENMPKLQLGFDILNALHNLKFHVSILIQYPNFNNPVDSKIVWCLKNAPDTDITITRNKSMIYGKVMVDDSIPHIERWLAHRPRGLVIMPAHEQNKDYNPLPNIIRYDGNNLDQIEEALAKARQRKAGEELAL